MTHERVKKLKGGFLDLTGERFGRLVALELSESRKYKGRSRTKWICKCDCGNVKPILQSALRNGKTKSCGCFASERASETKRTHGLSGARIYGIWRSMKARCNDKEEERYGGRGIRVCEEWQKFEEFYKWSMENGYDKELSIDRIDNDGNYEPGNCRWTTDIVQLNNTSRNVFTEVKGEVLTLSEIARKYEVPGRTLHDRYSSGLRGDDLLASRKRWIMLDYNGEIRSLRDWSSVLGFSYGTLQHRYEKGLRPPELFGPLNEAASRSANANKKRGGK
ncbi:hypothetical protein [Sporosarcina psychrophila]|uniref:hypothetical protein n=1 Tax=Sporosarcina psychrophila TaxID=1476 RepID=UPI00078E54EA|nr:hypothetical protein [Sporosarcina psychrophila]AMQ06766.1 hypothetical protein AZE41_12935 [Sporosarcina psychrophila]